MNIDLSLLNRALYAVNRPALRHEDLKHDTEEMRIIKDYYLATFREALDNGEWESAKRRRSLQPAQMPYKPNFDFCHVYSLPIDCEKSIELEKQSYFEVENGLLFTDASPALLLYVTNGRRVLTGLSANAGGAFRSPCEAYYTGGDSQRAKRYEIGDNIIFGGNASRADSVTLPDVYKEDFPEYMQLRFEPLFYQYVEKMLSYKLAPRLKDNSDIRLSFLQEAQAFLKRSKEVTSADSAARRKPPKGWAEKLGLS
jgi:hypothetical protein